MTRLHRIYLDQKIKVGESISLPEDTGHYLSRVLRVRAGHQLVVFNGDGLDYDTEVEQLARANVTLRVLDQRVVKTESALTITLVQAISRGERMDLTLQKATELGVTAVRPVFSTRTEVRLNEYKIQKRMAHWRKVLISASEQSGRSRVPKLFEPIELMFWAQQKSNTPRVMLIPGAGKAMSSILPLNELELLVGPEGGLDEKEIELLFQQGLVAIGLGPRILRTETAGPAAIAMLQALAGDMN